MNPEELRQLLSATPDEPPVPADPVAAVHRRARRTRNRRRGTAGALAVAVLAVVAGTAVVVPGHRSAGPDRIQVASPSSSADSATAAPTAPTTPTITSTSPSTPVSTATPPAPVVGLPFTWSVAVQENHVTIGGSWSGEDRTLTAAALNADPAAAAFAQVGSGVLGLDGYVTNTDGSAMTAAETAFGLPSAALYESDGDVPACDGPVVFQHRALPTRTFTVNRPGTYLLVMASTTCSGEATSTIPVTVTDVPLVLTQTLDVAPTAEVGVPLNIAFTLGSTLGGPGDVIDVVGQDGAVGRAGSAVYGSGCSGPGWPVSSYSAGWTFTSPGTYVILVRQVCDGLPAETGPEVPQSYVLPGPEPGYGGTAADALALAKADPAHASAVVVHVVPRPGPTTSTTPSGTPSTTPSEPPSTTPSMGATSRR